ncbi:hypothetical protein PaeCFBP13512_12675 [Paenibacillus sp. CFBP13512]|uniref:DUF6678 family protein n=1 Tax=Paenibacillus sp. CFBP13512 TaxID=2184007 RepID=UPI0010C07E63|nr:DUF6678 family protein [Paenibacillus sp. CFBP13512]TKJ90680.1 hypothetical protein PaeCFBP13512_12675 [Paenibacillus sp. CFBP13512]
MKADPDQIHKQKVIAEVEQRSLTSVMNHTRWNELKEAIYLELRFPPAFQNKYVLEAEPYPLVFEQDVFYLGDWESLSTAWYNVEWVRVKPRLLEHTGKYTEPTLLNIEAEWVNLLQRLRIPYLKKEQDYWIYGYATAIEFEQLGY